MKRAQQEELLRLSFIEFVLGELSVKLSRRGQTKCTSTCHRAHLITNLGTLPLHELAKTQQMKLIEDHLNKHGDVDCIDPVSGVTPLMTACSYGHLKVVELLVKRGADVNFRCSGLNCYGFKYSNITPAYIAAEVGRAKVLRYLVKKGADLNQKCIPLGFTPLHRAVQRGYSDLVRTMVKELKATVNISNSDGDDPVLTAVKMKAHEILETLLSGKGVNCSVPNTYENVTPLHCAAYNGDLKSVEKLLGTKKAKLNAELVGGFTPLDLAIQEKHKKTSGLLRKVGAQRNTRGGHWEPYSKSVAGGLLPLKNVISKGTKVNATIEGGDTALHYNVAKFNWEACKFLLKEGANVNSRNHLGNTPLHVAAKIGQTDYIKLLIDNGADVKAVNSAEITPLHVAAKKGHYSAAKLLISHHADLNAVEYEGGTPIFSAAAEGHANVVKLLLSCGVDPNSKARIKSIDHISVLLISCMHSEHEPDVIRALVDAGADVNYRIVTEKGELTALHLLPTEHSYYDESLKILIEAGAFIDASCTGQEDVLIGCTKQKIEVKKSPMEMIKNSKNEAAINMMRNTLELFKAVRKDDLKLAADSVARGGLVSCCSTKFETPLVYASWKGYLDMVKFLLKQGASLTMRAIKKSSPLHYAAKYNHKSIVIELLRAGAKCDAVCCGKTALQLAEEGKHFEVAAVLRFVGEWVAPATPDNVCPAIDPSFKNRLEETVDKVLENDLCALFGGV